MRGWISVLAALVTGAILAGVPTITGVTAQQRYPWNGMVDIAVTFEGASNDVAQADCSFVATNSVTKAALLVAHIERLGDDTGTGTTWTRRFVWDAGADVGEVKIADVTLSVEAEMPLGGVQLWENGPYWAECNVGATQPEEYGYYFWWGDTVGYAWSGGTSTDDFYYSDVTWVSSKKRRMRNSPFCSSSCPTDDKSTSMLLSEGYIDITGNLVAKYDAATAHLGAPWRMPTSEEIQALVDNCCTTTWTTRDGVYGQLVTGKGAYASKSIFLPAAGFGYDSDLNALGFCGGYLSSTPVSDDSSYAEDLYFDGLGPFCRGYDSRVYGQSVRPIRGFDSAGMCGMATTSLVLDTRTGTRTVAAKESIAYDATWGEAASGTLAVNDTAVSGLSKMGTYVWTPNTPQTNYWKLAYKAGTANYSATFQSLDKYTITYTETKGAANTNPTQYNILDSIMFTALPNVTGYMFKGWAPSKIDSGGFGAKTVIAQWTPITFTVKFNANGGTGLMADLPMTYDFAKRLRECSFKRVGYNFQGWATRKDGLVAYGDGDPVKNLTATDGGEVTLYAVWKRQDPWQVENDQPFNPLVANVYDGYLVGEDQSVVGTIQVKTAKQAVKKLMDKVTKEVSFVTNVTVTATVTDAAAKKWSYSKGALRMPITDGRTSVTGLVCTAKGVSVTNFEVSVGLNGMGGIWGNCEIVGARNGMGVKNDPMMAKLDGYKKSWSVTVGETRLQVMVGAKGTTKIVGVTPDGFKINASVQGVMGNGCLDVPYTATLKNGKLTKSVDLLLRIGADGTVDVLSSSLGGLAAGGATEEPVIADRRTAATLLAGVAYAEMVDIQELGYPAKFAATKLPTGLKINATTGGITGVPTKAGTFATTFKATSVANAKWIDQISRAYTVAPLPDWVVGTFDGGSEEGVATLTIAATGKISGKWLSAGTNWTLSAASFDAYDSETATYWATVIGKSGKLAFTNDLAISEAGVSSDHFAAWQNKWKVEPQKSEALTLKGQVVTQDVDGGELTLKVGASGTVSVTGRFVTGLDAKGLEIVYTATASSVLVPREAGGWKAIVYLPPKAGKFSGLVTEVAVFGGVQLWENGPYWSECNVGASTPEEFGYYFWWGDTVGYWRQEENWSAVDGSMTGFLFSEDNCPTYGRSNSQLMLEGYIDVTGKLVPAHDAATAHLGTPWRMPTAQEIDDLISNCTVTWMSFRGVYGCQVVGKGKYASRSIFFPAAGHCFDSCLNAAGSYGFYWTSTNGSFYGNEDPGYAWDFCFFSFSHISERYCSSRWDGHPVRPVRGFAK